MHELRKTLKRLRALVRLLRDPLGGKRSARENAALRDCARGLAGARDAEVMVGTLDGLVRRDPGLVRRDPGLTTHRGSRGDGILRLRAELVAEREQATASARSPVRRRVAIAELHAMRTRVLGWELREHPRDPAKLVTPGIERLYRRGDRRMRRARRRRDTDAMHAWRKSVKDLRYVAETLDREADRRERRDRGTHGAHRETRAQGSRAAESRAPSACAASPVARIASGRSWVRSTTWRCSRAGCASARSSLRAIGALARRC